MDKYDPLYQYLNESNKNNVNPTFTEVSTIIDRKVSNSLYRDETRNSEPCFAFFFTNMLYWG
jgi:hypothetical protein